METTMNELDCDHGQLYLDEEDCLGFKIWVAELELLVGSTRRQRKPDADEAYRVLQKLAVTMDRANRSEIKEYQRRAEDALIDILLKGVPPPVRRLICEILGRLYSQGDQLPLFSRVSSLQLFLGTKEATSKETSEDVRLGALELMTALYYFQGKSLTIGVSETANIVARYFGRNSSIPTRRAALRLLASAIEGVGGSHRDAQAVQIAALKVIERLLKEKELEEPLRQGVANVLRAIGSAGGGQLWANNLYWYEFSRITCMSGIHDCSSAAVRKSYASALYSIAFASTSEEAKKSISAAGSKKKHQDTQAQALEAVPDQCLLIPFAEAAARGDRLACCSIAQAWNQYLISQKLACGEDEDLFLIHALKPVHALSLACSLAGSTPEPQGKSGGLSDLGIGTAHGERPHAQACVLYIMRSAVVEQLGESGQRLLLDKLVKSILSDKCSEASLNFTSEQDSEETTEETESTPNQANRKAKNYEIIYPLSAAVHIVILELISLVIESLGEIRSDAASELENSLSISLCESHSLVRLQAASTFAAAAIVDPRNAAIWLSKSLRNLRSSADKLIDEACSGPDRSKFIVGTPRGPGTQRLRPFMNALEGWAMTVSTLLAASSRLPLGIPSHYINVALQIAAALIEAPRSSFEPVKCVERECGYLILSSICRMALPSLHEAFRSITDEGNEQTPMEDNKENEKESLWKANSVESKNEEDMATCCENDVKATEDTASTNLDEPQNIIEKHANESPTKVKSTIISDRKMTFEMESILSLWNPALGPESINSLEECFSGKESEQVIAMELWWRAIALQTLEEFLISLQQIGNNTCGDSSAFCLNDQDVLFIKSGVIVQLMPLVRLISSNNTLRNLLNVRSGPSSTLSASVAHLQLRLLRVCAFLPRPLFEKHIDLRDAIKSICLEGLQMAATVGTLGSLHETLLLALDYRDNSIGPWNIGRDPLERSLLLFSGSSGAPIPSCWDAGQRIGIGYTVFDKNEKDMKTGKSGILANKSYYPQFQSLSSGLFTLQSYILSTVMLSIPNQDQRLELLKLIILTADNATSRAKKDIERRIVSLLAVSMPILFAFSGGRFDFQNNMQGVLAKSFKSDVNGANEVLGVAEQLASAAANSDVGTSLLLHRTASNMYAAAARMNMDGFGTKLIQDLCHRAANTSSLSERTTFSLAVGGVARSLGSLGLSSVISLVMKTLLALITASSITIAPILLHALTSCASAAGLGFVPYVPASLQVAKSVLLNEDIFQIPGLLPAVGRLSNAIVAALGPEYVLGSNAYETCRSIINELRATDLNGIRLPDDAVASALESVFYSQMLVLFAPNAWPTSQHISVLVSTLPSRQPQLRKVAVDTLRHIAERDPSAVVSERIEPALLAAFDSETDPKTAYQLQATLQTLLHSGAATHPSRWINLCVKIINAKTSLESMQQDNQPVDEDVSYSDNKGKEYSMKYDKNESESNKAISPGNASSVTLSPRLRTRLFAAKCLLQIPDLINSLETVDSRHWDYLKALETHSNGDWFVMKTQILVDIGFQMVTGQLEAMRGPGIQLLSQLLHYLGKTFDPLAPQELLLAQYQAQYVSTLRASLADSASPEVQAAGAGLAASFLEKGLAGNDAVVLDKLLGLLCAPLSKWLKGLPDPAQASYAEWVAARARVALLESHAHCVAAISSNERDNTESINHQNYTKTVNDIVTRSQGPFFTLLVDCWIGLLNDRAVLQSDRQDCIKMHKLSLFGKQCSDKAPALSVVASGIVPDLNRAWPIVLESSAKILARDRTAAYGTSGRERHGAIFDIAVSGIFWDMNENIDLPNERDVGLIQGLQPNCGISSFASCLKALCELTTHKFAKENWIELGRVKELMMVVHVIVKRADFWEKATQQHWHNDFDASHSAPSIIKAGASLIENVSFIYLNWTKESNNQNVSEIQTDLIQTISSFHKMKGDDSRWVGTLQHLFNAMENMFEATDTEEKEMVLCYSLSFALQVLDDLNSTKEEQDAALRHVVSIVKKATVLSLKMQRVELSGPDQLPSCDQIIGAATISAAQQALKYYERGKGNSDLIISNMVSCLQLASVAVGDISVDQASCSEGPCLPTKQLCSRAQQICIQTMKMLLSPEKSKFGFEVRTKLVHAMCEFFESHPPPIWAAQLASVTLPLAIDTFYHGAECRNTNEDMVVEEAIALLDLGMQVCELGGEMQRTALNITITFAVDTAGELLVTENSKLIDASVRILMALAKGSLGESFRSSVASLPEKWKSRLQEVLARASSCSCGPRTKNDGKQIALNNTRIPIIPLNKFN